jgi:hypothetical protein
MRIEVAGDGWKVAPIPSTKRGSAGGFPRAFLHPDVAIAEVFDLVSAKRRGSSEAVLFVTDSPNDEVILAVRHPSGALTLHAPAEAGALPTAAVGSSFVIESRAAAPTRSAQPTRLRITVLRMTRAAARTLRTRVAAGGFYALARRAEERWWTHAGLREGLYRVRWKGGPAVTRVARLPARRSLLLFHGTFSHAEGSFRGLLSETFLSEAERLYPGGVYAFQHFTVSRSLEENVRMFLGYLPRAGATVDAIGYSRGGLLLRILAEQGTRFGPSRLRLEKAVLLAVPNQGTPLATAARWDEIVGWIANLIEACPKQPWTLAASFVAEGIRWLLARLSCDLPGLAGMDSRGRIVVSLRESAAGHAGRYAAVGANFSPPPALLARLLDLGLDRFFRCPNDMVVPTAGAWMLADGEDLRGRVLCYGVDGNLPGQRTPVHHLNVMSTPETRRFVLTYLRNEPLQYRPLKTGWKITRGKAGGRSRPVHALPAEDGLRTSETGIPPQREGNCTLHLMLLGMDGRKDAFIMLGMYGNARVVEPFLVRNTKPSGAGSRFEAIIRQHEEIMMHFSGIPASRTNRVPPLPAGEALRRFGALLFDALFTGEIRRLYDMARSGQRGRVLNVVLTSAIPWLAAKPWELAYDTSRHRYLALEEVHFVRNVLTAVPAEELPALRRQLRMLVVSAQPLDAAALSLHEEEEQIRYRFRSLTESGRMEVDALVHATPEMLHDALTSSRERYDILHFMGHGEFEKEGGSLLFESTGSRARPVDAETLKQLLCGRGIQLVFLNACETGRDSRKDSNRGVAQALMSGGIPAVIANQYPVADSAAIAFATKFYSEMAAGNTLAEAVRESRIAVRFASEPHSLDWAVPMLFARDPDLRLCAPDSDAEPPKPPPGHRKTAGGVRRLPKKLSVGVTDLDWHFPDLRRYLDHFTKAQGAFVFAEVRDVAPLSAWTSVKGAGHLDAEGFGRFLEKRRKTSRADLLCCFTKAPLGKEGKVQRGLDFVCTGAACIISLSGEEIPVTGHASMEWVARQIVRSILNGLLGMEPGDSLEGALEACGKRKKDAKLIAGCRAILESSSL